MDNRIIVTQPPLATASTIDVTDEGLVVGLKERGETAEGDGFDEREKPSRRMFDHERERPQSRVAESSTSRVSPEGAYLNPSGVAPTLQRRVCAGPSSDTPRIQAGALLASRA